jgi:hypothetical protein
MGEIAVMVHHLALLLISAAPQIPSLSLYHEAILTGEIHFEADVVAVQWVHDTGRWEMDYRLVQQRRVMAQK